MQMALPGFLFHGTEYNRNHTLDLRKAVVLVLPQQSQELILVLLILSLVIF